MKQLRITKVEFGESADGTATPPSFSEIPSLAPLDIPAEDATTVQLADGTEVLAYAVKTLPVRTYEVDAAVLATLRTYQGDWDNKRIWVKLTDIGGNIHRFKNLRVSRVVESGGQDAATVEIVFQASSADGAFRDTAGSW